MTKTHLLMLAAAFALAMNVAQAQDAAASGKETKQITAAEADSWCDKIFGLGKIYKDDTNPFIEEFDITGRLQLDYYHVDADSGKPSKNGTVDYFEIRRFRLGEDAWFADRHLEIKADVDTNLESRHSTRVFYNRMTNLFANFVVDDAFKVKIGKQEPHFGYDREVSDTLQPFFERSFFDDQVFNNTGNDYASGATVYGKIGNFGYLASAFSLNVDKEFGQFNGGESYLGEVSYDLKSAFGSDKALWVLDYMHTSGLNVNSNVFNTMRNAVATYIDYKKGRFGLVGQFGYENGIASKGDVYQFMAMPTYDITDKLQVEFRYSLGLGSENNSITMLTRQQKQVAKGTGSALNSPYLGFNYFICGYNLHVMAGVQYDSLTGGSGAHANFSGWTPMVGLRTFF
jgi:phosphate-selective porin OprO and OprP